MAFNAWERIKGEESELNLIPVMNLMMTLIPFLLLGAAFYHIGVIPTSLPRESTNTSDVPKTPVTVTLNLVIKPDKVAVSASSTSLSPEDLAAIALELPGKDGKFALDKLAAHVLSIKQNYPKSSTVVVLPAETVKQQTLVNVLDAVRDREIDQGPGKDPLREELFPVAVFSRFIPPPPEPAPGEEGDTGEGGEPGAAPAGEPAGEPGGEPAGDEGGALDLEPEPLDIPADEPAGDEP